ncbi:MAG: PEP-CTERM sorting domain-containing protein, partial [Verrucomicrobiae bacterium]|nr:PEP-CTERM sorting domain-containing protein [Verrucomicrobiae bacterium]NNJ85850.1 PEP-CTERM sorting domain-containing protein [Akkermansiaceae bacterium]
GGVVGLEFSFTGGDSNYKFDDGTVFDGDSFTADGVDIDFTLTASGQYSVAGGSVTGTLNNSLTTIDRIEVFNISAGPGDDRNVFFNNLSVVPEPSSAALLGLGCLALLMRRRK